MGNFLIIEPITPLIKAGLLSELYSLAISMASSATTLCGSDWENNSSQVAKRKIARSTWLILLRGHFGAFSLIFWSTVSMFLIISNEALVRG